MKPAQTLIRKTAALLIGAALGLSHIGVVMSHDTDIYFSNPNAQQQAILPNVMVIIDTSGSMVSNTLPDGRTRLEHMKDAFNAILDDPSTSGIKMGLMRFSGQRGGPVLFPVADLDATAVSVVGNDPVTVEAASSASNDDAEENITSGSVSVTDTPLDLVNNGTNAQIVGVRFQNVSVPKGAVVTAAYILFQPSIDDSGATSLTIKAQNSGNPGAFTATTNDVSTRTNTANAVAGSVDWSSVSAWSIASGDRVVSPDLKTLVQPLVNRADWCGGNSMLFTFEGSGQRRAYSYDGNAAGAPILVVQYDPTTVPTGACNTKTLQVKISTGNDDAEERVSNGNMTRNGSPINMIRGSNDQLVGLRFQNIAVPAGATIVSAFIDFTINATDSSTPSYTIVGQKTVNPGSFTSGNKNISNRVDTAAEKTVPVSWSSVPNPSAGSTLTTPDLKTIVDELINGQSSWTSGNPMVFVVTGSGTRKIESYDGSSNKAAILRIKYTSNDSASVSTDTVRLRLKQIVNGLQAAGNTPIVDTLYEAGLYYRGQPVLYGLKRGDQSGTDAQYTRISHRASYTGADGIFRAVSCTDADLNASACATEEILGAPTYISPFVNGCQNSYIVLLTDGAPTANNSVTLVQSLIAPATCAGTGSGQCSNELADYYFNNNLSSFTDKHNVVTHTVGFGSDVTNATDVAYLQGLAAAGRGTFHAAQDASALVTAFQQILAEVNSAPTAFVSPSLSVNAFNKLFNRDEVYFSLFSPQAEVRWPGNVKKFTLCNDATNANCIFGEVLDANGASAIGTDSKIKLNAKSLWSSVADGPTVQLGGAGENIPAKALRKVYTYTGTADVPSSAVDLTTTPVNTTNATKTLLGGSAMTDQRQTDIVNWMLGQDVKDEDKDLNTTEDRWKFADALHSRPLTIAYGGINTDPVIKIFVGTNDGAFRMINSKNGKEEWAVYIPDFLAIQGPLMDNALGTHTPGLDGTATAYLIDNNRNGKIEPENATGKNDKVYLFIGERRGGKDIYAFDVTPDAEITDANATDKIKPKFLWRIKGGAGNFGALGQTWSRPTLANIRVKCTATGCVAGDSVLKTVLIFAGGYEAPRLDSPGVNKVVPPLADSMGNAIYIIDPLNGSRVWWASNVGSGANLELTNMSYAIPSDVSMLDTNGDGAVDRLYVGDSRGQLWRLDLGDQIDSGSTGAGGSSGYVFADVGCDGDTRANDCALTTRQNHRKFFYPPDVASASDPVYSTAANPDYDVVAITSGDREDPLDKLTAVVSPTEEPVHNRAYGFRDYNFKTGAPASTPVPLTESYLVDITTTDLTALIGSDPTTVQNSKGWFIDLREATAPIWKGEKGLAKPVIFGGTMFFTTFVPTNTTSSSSGACTPLSEGTGRIYAINYLTGAAVYNLNANNGSGLDKFVDVGGGIPSEAVVVIREGGVTTLVGTSGGASRPDVEMKLPRYTTYWYDE